MLYDVCICIIMYICIRIYNYIYIYNIMCIYICIKKIQRPHWPTSHEMIGVTIPKSPSIGISEG